MESDFETDVEDMCANADGNVDWDEDFCWQKGDCDDDGASIGAYEEFKGTGHFKGGVRLFSLTRRPSLNWITSSSIFLMMRQFRLNSNILSRQPKRILDFFFFMTGHFGIFSTIYVFYDFFTF